MLSGRGFWIALCVTAGGLYAAWRSRTRHAGVRRMMHVRSKESGSAPQHGAGMSVIRRQLEPLLGVDLTHLRPQDKVATVLDWDESRRLVESLEQALDTTLPDVRAVRSKTFGELCRCLGTKPEATTSES